MFYQPRSVRAFKRTGLQFYLKVHAAKPQDNFGISERCFYYSTSQSKKKKKNYIEKNLVCQVRQTTRVGKELAKVGLCLTHSAIPSFLCWFPSEKGV